jgi:hypothetical protein
LQNEKLFNINKTQLKYILSQSEIKPCVNAIICNSLSIQAEHKVYPQFGIILNKSFWRYR